MLELSFQTRDIRTICEEDTKAQERLGRAAAKALLHRLADLRAASTVSDIMVGNLRPDKAYANGSVLILDLEDGWVMHFMANHANIPITKDDMVDWSRVNRIKILDIVRTKIAETDMADA